MNRAGSPTLRRWLGLACLSAACLVSGARSSAAQSVTYDNTSTGTSTTSSLTFNHTVGSGSNRLLLVAFSTNSSATVSDVTYGGVSLTRVASGLNGSQWEIWRLVSPTSGTAQVAVTFGGNENSVGAAVSFSDVDQGAPLGHVASATGNSGAPSVTVTSRAGDMVLDVLGSQANSVATGLGASQTQRWNTVNNRLGAGSTAAGGTSVTMSWTTASANWAIGAVSIRHVPQSPGSLATGSYAGDGTSPRSFANVVGFQPDFLYIKCRANCGGSGTNVGGVARTATMGSDKAKDMGDNLVLAAGYITSFDPIAGNSAGGFTVGNNARVNASTGSPTYDWVALTAKSGEVFVGSYVGTGAEMTIRVGFQPDALFIIPDSGQLATWATSSMSLGQSLAFETTNVINGDISALTSDGFTVAAAKNRVNADGVTYHFVAWKATSARLQVGTYTGNAGDSRDISLASGFGKPEWVITKAQSGGDNAAQKAASTDAAVDTACFFAAVACTSNWIQALQTDGFQVGTLANMNSVIYQYIAFGRSVPTAVRMSWATATRYGDGTYLQWRTGYESDNLGFHVYREVRGGRTRITSALIAGSALTVRRAGAGGQSYQWWDTTPVETNAPVRYWIEDVDLNGTTTMHGPVRPVTAGGPVPGGAPSRLLTRLIEGHASPARGPARRARTDVARTDAGARATRPAPSRGDVSLAADPGSDPTTALPPATIETLPVKADGPAPSPGVVPLDDTTPVPQQAPAVPLPTRGEREAAASNQRSLAGGVAIKVGVTQEGWYRVTQPQLVSAGYDPGAEARTLQLFTDGVEQPLRLVNVRAGRLGADAAIEFYATARETPYSDARVYWLRWRVGVGRRVPTLSAGTAAAATVASFPFTTEHRPRQIFFAALLNGEAENFFGEVVSSEPTAITLNAAYLAASGAPAVLEVVLQGVTEPGAHGVAVELNGHDVGRLDFRGRTHVGRRFAVPISLLVEGDNTLTLTATGGESDVSLVDAVRLTYPRRYVAQGDRLRFSAPAGQVVSVTGFTTGALRVVDVTDAGAPRELLGRVEETGGGYGVTFVVPGSGARALLALATGGARQPHSVGANSPSSLGLALNAATYVIVAPAEFTPAAAALRKVREASGHAVAVVDIEDVYDEFEFGHKSPHALRAFLVRAKAAWRVKPAFVTLLGNATSDPKNYLGMDEPDFVPTKLVGTAAFETASDDWFVDRNGDGIPELAAIGRLPARSLEQARAMVEKIAAYDRADGGWTREISLVADRMDAGDMDFAAAMRQLEPLIPPFYVVNEIFKGTLGVDAARAELLQRLNDGQAIINYSGHGSVDLWRDDLLTAQDVTTLANGTRLPVFVLMNCLNGFFQGLFPEESLAEALIRSGQGGAVAVWASSGFTEPEGQAQMNRAFYRLLFEGRAATLGEAAAAAKKFTGDRDVRRTWIFFGDPALRLAGMPILTTPGRLSEGGPKSGPPARTGPQGGSIPTASPGVNTSDAGDPDGDGRAHTLSFQGRTWQVLLPGARRVQKGMWQNGFEVFPGRFNDDDLTDLFLFERATGTWTVALNAGDGEFTYTGGTVASPSIVTVIDIDGDGLEDVMLVDAVTGAAAVAISDGAGGFRRLGSSI